MIYVPGCRRVENQGFPVERSRTTGVLGSLAVEKAGTGPENRRVDSHVVHRFQQETASMAPKRL